MRVINELEHEVEDSFHLKPGTIDIPDLFGEYGIDLSDEAIADITDSIDYGRRVGWQDEKLTHRMMVIYYLRHEFPNEESVLWSGDHEALIDFF